MDSLVALKDIETLSPYGKFMVANQGYDFYNKDTYEKLDRWEMWEKVENRPRMLSDICSGAHPVYLRVKREK